MKHVVDWPVVHERRSGALVQLGVTYKQVDLPAILLVIDDASALAGFRCCGVLALPVEGAFVYPVIQVLVIFCLALLIQSDEQNMGLLVMQNDVPDVPQALIKREPEQWGDVFTQEGLSNGQLKRVQHLLEFGQRGISSGASMNA